MRVAARDGYKFCHPSNCPRGRVEFILRRMASEGASGMFQSSSGVSYLDGEEERGPVIPAEDKKLNTREDVVDILKSIEECDGMNTLRLSGNSFGVEACLAIGEAIVGKPTLKRLLWSDMFVSRLTTEIPPSLTSLGESIISSEAQLVELDLSDNAFGPSGVQAVTNLLTSPASFTLKVLKFNNNGLGIGGGKILAGALLDCHAEARNAGQRLALEVFVAGRNRLESPGATAMAEVFETLGSLVQVSMPQNGINPDGICALAKAFSKNPHLQVIDLNDNTFRVEGSKAVAEVLPSLQELRMINFGDCLVRSEGATAISEAIRDGHKLLEEVNLSYCELNTDAGIAIASALGNKEELKRVELNGNWFGEDGVEMVRGVLESKGRLDALGSLSDDEGDEEEEEGEEEEGEEEEGEEEEGEEEEGEGDGGPVDETEDVSVDERLQVRGTAIAPPQTITLDVYLADPTGENLLALGNDRGQLIVNSLGDNPETEAVASLYAKITACYTMDCSEEVKQVVEEAVDAILEQPCQANTTSIINAILVQVGLIKSEDKKFKPVKDIDGPLLALTHVVKQPYFPRGTEEVLIAFVNKTNTVIDSQNPIRHQLLQVLHTL